jgi:hypothetical protein
MQHRGEPLAEREQTVEAEALLVGGDLEDTIDRGVADRPTGALVFLAQPGDDIGAAGVAVAENTVGAGEALDLRHDVIGKGGIGSWKVAPVPRHRQAGKFPVARWRVLAGAYLLCGAP